MEGFKIDFFELMFLAESCIPPAPIARTTFWHDLCDVHYHKMSKQQRAKCFEWIKQKLDLHNEECRYFYARFNPLNQYSVKFFFQAKAQDIEVFRFNDKYQVSRYVSINEDYVKAVDKIPYLE